MNSLAPYSDRQISLLTQHGKERVIAPVLEAALGCQIQLNRGYNTDLLGTFSRDIPRAATQIEAARKKALIGMALSGLPLGLASEGSFGPDPFAGLFPWNVEYLIFIDQERNLEVVGSAQGKASLAHLLTNNWESAENFARHAGFPDYLLVVRPEGQDDPRIQKEISSWDKLQQAFNQAQAASNNNSVLIETDLRAHANPLRMETIQRAAEDLARRLHSCCPECGTPGFWQVERIAGLPCGECGEPTRETLAELYGCHHCGHRERHKSQEPCADPGRCDNCNP